MTTHMDYDGSWFTLENEDPEGGAGIGLSEKEAKRFADFVYSKLGIKTKKSLMENKHLREQLKRITKRYKELKAVPIERTIVLPISLPKPR